MLTILLNCDRKSVILIHNKLLLLYVDIRRRIELIQDFEMPTASTNIEISQDGNYVLASGESLLYILGRKIELKASFFDETEILDRRKFKKIFQCQNSSIFYTQGCYKPRVRCYDLLQMSMKFERCLDSDSKYYLTINISLI